MSDCKTQELEAGLDPSAQGCGDHPEGCALNIKEHQERFVCKLGKELQVQVAVIMAIP